jgi:hypothetical protein
MINMSKSEKISALIFLIVMGLIFFLVHISQNNKQQLIDENKIITIGKVYEIKSKRSFTSLEYYYFYDKKMYFSNCYVDDNKRNLINKYFKIELSSLNPKYSNIFLDTEVTDSVEIIRSGFRISNSN